jgi:tripartite ATP-independent transporter DctM subunit
MVSLCIVIIFFGLLIFGAPISVAMGFGCLVPILLGQYPPSVVPQIMVEQMQSVAYLAIPFFIFAGNLMNATGVTKRIFSFANAAVGHLRGGLAHVNVIASLIFAGISGSALADCAGLGAIEIKAMTDAGFHKRFSCAITLASSTLGPIMPPSISLLIYAVLADTSIAEIFVAGVVPSFLMVALLIATTYVLIITKRIKTPPPTKISLIMILKTFGKGFLALFSPVVVFSGLIFGLATPTELGVIVAMWSVVVGVIYGELDISQLRSVFFESVVSTALIMFLIGTGSLIGYFLTVEGTTQLLADSILSISNNKIIILMLINIMLLILGLFLESLPIKIITIPIFLPVIESLGIDPVHFGIIMCLNILVGIATPPVGIGLYVMMGVGKISFEEITRAVFPYVIALLIGLFIVTYVPSISMFLPTWLLR